MEGKILITGGAGTLGHAIVRHAKEKSWDARFTILSRDPLKLQSMQHEHPGCDYVLGDVCDLYATHKAMKGQDVVIHAAAQKHIPEGERHAESTTRINVIGSRNVAMAARLNNVSHVVGISTDKACYPVNTYGATKMLMERIFQEKNSSRSTSFHLVRYGNVLGSNGSVLEVWRDMIHNDGYITATHPDMTRFWLTENDAVDLVADSVVCDGGTILIPKLGALFMSEMAHYLYPDVEIKYSGLRPGEKMHERLLTEEESYFVTDIGNNILLRPMSGDRNEFQIESGYTSDDPAFWITKDKLLGMLREST